LITELLSVQGGNLVSQNYFVWLIRGGETLRFLPSMITQTEWLQNGSGINPRVESFPTNPGWAGFKPVWVEESAGQCFTQQLDTVQALDTQLPRGLVAKFPSAEELCYLMAFMHLRFGHSAFPPTSHRLRLLNRVCRGSSVEHLVLGRSKDGELYISSCSDSEEAPDLGSVALIRIYNLK